MSLWEIRCLYERLDVYIRDYMSLWEIRCLYERLDVYIRDSYVFMRD